MNYVTRHGGNSNHNWRIVLKTRDKVRIPDYPDGNSGGIRTLNRRHPDTLSINLILH